MSWLYIILQPHAIVCLPSLLSALPRLPLSATPQAIVPLSLRRRSLRRNVLNRSKWKCVLSKTQYCDVITKCASKCDMHISRCCVCSPCCPVAPCTAAPSYRTARRAASCERKKGNCLVVDLVSGRCSALFKWATARYKGSRSPYYNMTYFFVVMHRIYFRTNGIFFWPPCRNSP
jgi:hypothetical protein